MANTKVQYTQEELGEILKVYSNPNSSRDGSRKKLAKKLGRSEVAVYKKYTKIRPSNGEISNKDIKSSKQVKVTNVIKPLSRIVVKSGEIQIEVHASTARINGINIEC